MQTKSEKGTPGDLTFAEVMRRFGDDESARLYIEKLRWPNGPVCPHCKNNDQETIWKIEANKEKKIRAGLYQCRPCLKQFTVTVGTIFEDSHIPLGKWLVAWYMICSSKKGVSSLQMQRILGLGSYRSAHFMMHRIRHALKDDVFNTKLEGTVEVDETYVGGVAHGGTLFKDGKYLTKFRNKTPVVSLVERDGSKRSIVMNRVSAANLREVIKEHVAPSATIMTDDSRLYLKTHKTHKHHAVNHSKKQYVLHTEGENVNTNTVECSFSLLKRGIVGTFHQISKQHLPLYLAEFDHRWNTRKKTDGQRTVAGLKKIEGKRLVYKKKVKPSLVCAAKS